MPKVLQPIPRLQNAVMTGTQVLTSQPVDGRYLEQIKFLIAWTGNPSGTFSLQESMDFNPVSGVGTWYDNGAGISPAIGADGSAIINLSNRAPCFYQVVYTNASGTGSLNVWASGSGPL